MHADWRNIYFNHLLSESFLVMTIKSLWRLVRHTLTASCLVPSNSPAPIWPEGFSFTVQCPVTGHGQHSTALVTPPGKYFVKIFGRKYFCFCASEWFTCDLCLSASVYILMAIWKSYRLFRNMEREVFELLEGYPLLLLGPLLQPLEDVVIVPPEQVQQDAGLHFWCFIRSLSSSSCIRFN